MLLLVNVFLALLRPSLWVTTAFLLSTSMLSMYLMLVDRWRIPPLLDLSFVFGTILYFGLPGVFYVYYTGHAPVESLPLQQALVGSAVATFHLARHLSGWKSWRAVEAKLESPGALVLKGPLATALLIVSGVWIATALPGLSGYMSTEYGARSSGQRSELTIQLIGFTFLPVVLMAMLTEKILVARNWRTWWAIGVVGFAVYGLAQVAIFGERTRLVLSLVLAAVAAMPVRRLTLNAVFFALAVVVALLPLFDLIGRARTTFHIAQPTIDEVDALGVGEDLETLAVRSEFVGMVSVGDEQMNAFAGEIMYGQYVAWSILQSPPSFVLKPLGLRETRSLAGRYTETYYPNVWFRGGAYGLPLSAESYLNFRELGGVFSGVGLWAFIVFFEHVILGRLPFAFALAFTSHYMVVVARVNRGGLEGLAKPVAVMLVMLGVVKASQYVVRRRAGR